MVDGFGGPLPTGLADFRVKSCNRQLKITVVAELQSIIVKYPVRQSKLNSAKPAMSPLRIRLQSIKSWAVLSCALLSPLTALSNEEIPPISYLVAPADLVATYTCTTLGETLLAAQVIERIKKRKEARPPSETEMKDILQRFDTAVYALCQETQRVFVPKTEEVAANFTKNSPGLFSAEWEKSEWSKLAKDPKVIDWFKRNNDLLVSALQLKVLHTIVVNLNPALLDPELRLNVDLMFTLFNDDDTKNEFKTISSGELALIERRKIALLLGSASFIRLMPSRYDAAVLKRVEQETRKTGTVLFQRSIVRLQQFSNGYWATRANFTSINLMRDMGVANAYSVAEASVDKIK